MTSGIDEFYKTFMQDVWGAAAAERQFSESSFVELFADYLLEAGEIDSFDYTPLRSSISHGIQVDGYAGDPAETDGILTLIVSDFNQEDVVGSLTKIDIGRIFRKVERFLSLSIKNDFYTKLEESSPGFGVAQMINERRRYIRRVRIVLISNRILSQRVERMEESSIEEIPVSYTIWDISRLYRLVISGKGKEDVDIDLLDDFGTPILCLPAHLEGAGYKAYLAVVPGELLASIYDKWGSRLLEQNVRCFLQFRGKVNKGIRNTIQNEPEMFFAYNNGITATAESVETKEKDGTLCITRIKNLQIVNGGQTTASIFMAQKKSNVSISKIFVQMKLSIVEPERAMKVVPRISECANTQNKVNAADFFSNHPFHVRVEDFSRRIYAPSSDGTFRETKWFYERARGQYLDKQSLMTPAQKRKFRQEYPRCQLFSKTDLAKFENVWECIPHIVSKGAQYNFAKFANVIGLRWKADSDQFNEHWYHCAIARAIIFRSMEKIVSAQPWYSGGYRANIVAYSISKLADLLLSANKSIDYEKIWKKQKISSTLHDVLVEISTLIHPVIVNPPEGISNVTEWAKKESCWAKVHDLKIEIPRELDKELISIGEISHRKKDAKKIQKIDNSVMAQAHVVELGSTFWEKVYDWCRTHRFGSPKDIGIIKTAMRIPSKIPSDKQCVHLMKFLERVKNEGFQLMD
jgi:hypothetical protein